MADLTGQTIKIPVASVARDLTVEVKLTGLRRWHLRLRLGIWLMRFAIWVAGMGCEVKGPPEDASGNESFGGDEYLTERGKEVIGTLRQMRANDDPRLRYYSVRKHAFVSCSRCQRERKPSCPPA